MGWMNGDDSSCIGNGGEFVKTKIIYSEQESILLEQYYKRLEIQEKKALSQLISSYGSWENALVQNPILLKWADEDANTEDKYNAALLFYKGIYNLPEYPNVKGIRVNAITLEPIEIQEFETEEVGFS